MFFYRGEAGDNEKISGSNYPGYYFAYGVDNCLQVSERGYLGSSNGKTTDNICKTYFHNFSTVSSWRIFPKLATNNNKNACNNDMRGKIHASNPDEKDHLPFLHAYLSFRYFCPYGTG